MISNLQPQSEICHLFPNDPLLVIEGSTSCSYQLDCSVRYIARLAGDGTIDSSGTHRRLRTELPLAKFPVSTYLHTSPPAFLKTTRMSDIQQQPSLTAQSSQYIGGRGDRSERGRTMCCTQNSRGEEEARTHKNSRCMGPLDRAAQPKVTV